MDQVCFALPVVEGRTGDARAFFFELEQQRKAEFDASERRIGITKWLSRNNFRFWLTLYRAAADESRVGTAATTRVRGEAEGAYWSRAIVPVCSLPIASAAS